MFELNGLFQLFLVQFLGDEFDKIMAIDVEIGAHTWAKTAFLHTVYAPFYGAPSVYALVSKMAARVAYRITADTYVVI